MTEELTDRRGQPVVDPFPPGYGLASSTSAPPPDQGYRRRRRRGRAGNWVAGILTVLLIAAVLVAAPWDPQRRQTYADQWIVWTEPPGAEVSRLAEQLTLTETGRRVFFASRPQIEAARDFEANCDFEAAIVLGCYGAGRIHVYDVTDARLAGTVEATAAHELLHAVYERMPADDRGRVDRLVADFVTTLPDDDANVTIVADYPASQRADEWHSRVGTSYAALPAELEQHYARIFDDRARVVAFDSGSMTELEGYTDRIDQLSAELDSASSELAARSSAYDSAIVALDSDIETFNTRASSGGFDSQDAFDRARSELLKRQSSLESERLSLNAAVADYNATLAELQSLDAARAELYSHLDSHSAP